MKLIAFFSRLALTAVAGFILGAAFGVQPLALFAAAIAALVLLVAAGDYAPRAAIPRSRPADIVPFTLSPAQTETPAKIAA